MVNRLKIGALSSLAAGAATGYYGFHLLYGRDSLALAILFSVLAAAALISLCRVLALGSGGGLIAPRYGRFFRHWGLHITALSAGLVLGIGISASIPRNSSLGLPVGNIIALQGTLLSDPRALSSGSGMAYLNLEKSAGTGGLRASAKGKILVFFPEQSIPALKEFGRGSGVYVEGSFRNQDNLLFSATAVHIFRPASALEQFRTGLRLEITRRFTQGQAVGSSAGSGVYGNGGYAAGNSAAQNSWGGMALALLLGIKDNLDTDLARAYREAGSSYVLALSGMHLAVLSTLIAFILKRPLGLKASGLAGAVFIVLYVFLVGYQPSLDRAAIMYLLGVLAVFGALPRNPSSLLSLAFLVQIVRQNDSGIAVSFILSYLALWGILHVGESIHELLRGKVPEMVLSPLTASMGAFIATAAVSVYYFGELRLIGIAAGLFIVPLTTVFMIGALIWLVLSFCVPVLTVPLGAGLSFLYRVLDALVRFAAQAPGFTHPNFSAMLAVSLGLSVLAMYLGSRRRVLRSRLVPLP